MKYEIYLNLSKEEQKKVREDFKKTVRGYELTKRYNRLVVTGTLCLLLAFALIIMLVFYELEWYYILLFIGLVICGPLFLIGQYNLRMQQYCRFIKLSKKAKKISKIKG